MRFVDRIYNVKVDDLVSSMEMLKGLLVSKLYDMY